MFWSCLMYFALIQAPRLYQLTAKVRDQFWYDGWIIQMQEDFITAKAREEKEAKNQNANNSSAGGNSSGGSVMSGSGEMTSRNAAASIGGGSQLGNTSQLGTNGSSLGAPGSMRQMKQPIGGATKPTGVGRVIPSTRNKDGTLRRQTTTEGRPAAASVVAPEPGSVEPMMASRASVVDGEY
jgi:hypothetical protein